MSLRTFTFSVAVALALSGVSVSSALARPPGPPPGAPGWHRPAPPPRYHHRHHYGWLWAPAIAGVTIWGLSSLHNEPYEPYATYVPYRYRTSPSYVAPNYGENISESAPKTLYWCEAEKGFYPQVRACPTGWTPVVAP